MLNMCQQLEEGCWSDWEIKEEETSKVTHDWSWEHAQNVRVWLSHATAAGHQTFWCTSAQEDLLVRIDLTILG